MEEFEEKLHQDLHQFLLSMKEVDERMPECPDVEGKWEEIAKAYATNGRMSSARSSRHQRHRPYMCCSAIKEWVQTCSPAWTTD